MQNNQIKDANGNLIELTKDDFVLINDKKKIHDKEFDTRPTTFFRDALKRFAKNRSSVAAAIIIGIILLLSIFVPIIDKNPITTSPFQSLLEPRLFSKGDFWSGKTKYEDNYNLNTDSISSYNMKYVDIKKKTYYYTDQTNASNYGGTFVLSSLFNVDDLEGDNLTSATAYIGTSQVELNQNKPIYLNLSLFNEELNKSTTYAEYSKAEYKIYVFANNNQYLIKDYSSDSNITNLNIIDALKSNSFDFETNKKGLIRIEMKPVAKKLQYLAIDSLSLTSSDTILNEELKGYTIVSNNADSELVKQYGASVQSSSKLFLSNNAKKAVYQAKACKVNFTYDYYEEKFGTQVFTLTKNDIQKYINNKWIKYTFGKADSFEKLSDESPVERIIAEKKDGSVVSFEAEVTMYKYYGYKSMPKFIAGTDNQGRDLFKYAFLGLRNSLIIAFIVSIINFTIGIIYGSIEGYFGGNVDLFMERITDILGYLPTIVILTLLMSKYGKTFGIFALGLIFTGWLGIAGRTRTQFYRFKGREYVLASRTLGASDIRLIFKHVLPNAIGTIVTMSVLIIPGVIFTESTLSYLGLGLEGTDSFGTILSANQQFLSTHSQLVLFPSFILAMLMISFNLFGNGLRDALNPSLKGSD